MNPVIRELFESEILVARRDHRKLVPTLERLLTGREIEAVLPGVYALPHAGELLPVRLAALKRYDPDAILLSRAAARLSFWPDLPVPAVAAAVKHERASPTGFAFTRRRVPEDLVTEVEGFRMTTPALTALDLCLELDGDGIDEVLRRQKASLDELHAAMALLGRQPGNGVRRRFLAESSDEPWSKAERILHRLLREAGIEGWRGNVMLTIDGNTYFVDALFRADRLAVEVDGRHFHGEARFEIDRWRQNALVLDGWRVLRFTWRMLEDYPDRVIETVERALCGESRTRRAA